MDDVIKFKDYSWQYEDKDEDALKIPELTIEAGGSVGIVGPNEQGKTTLVRTLNGLIPYNYRGVMNGKVEILGQDLLDIERRRLSSKIGMVFSDPDSQFTSMSVEEELIFGLENLNFSLSTIKERLNWITQTLDLEAFLDKPPYDLSGGQKQKVAIASVVIMKPKILILDEPTSMVDPRGKNEIFNILKKLKKEENLTLIIVEHNLEELVKVVNRIIHIDNNTLKYTGTVKDFINNFNYDRNKIYPPEISSIFKFLQKHEYNIDNIPYILGKGIQKFKEL